MVHISRYCRAPRQQPKAEEDGPAISIVSRHQGGATDWHLHSNVGDVALNLLVDTGAAATLMNKDVWDKVSASQCGLRLHDVASQKQD